MRSRGVEDIEGGGEGYNHCMRDENSLAITLLHLILSIYFNDIS